MLVMKIFQFTDGVDGIDYEYFASAVEGDSNR